MTKNVLPGITAFRPTAPLTTTEVGSSHGQHWHHMNRSEETDPLAHQSTMASRARQHASVAGVYSSLLQLPRLHRYPHDPASGPLQSSESRHSYTYKSS
jgi:hypothetical protein